MSKSLPPRSRARFIAVVGPSGAGKDSVMRGLCARCPDLHRVRRAITRVPDANSEVFDALSEREFAARAAAGAFALRWTAHGLSYGIPTEVHDVLARGRDVLANLSRSALSEAAEVFEEVVVLHVTAPPQILSQRVADRGREAGDAVKRRLSRRAPKMPEDVPMIEIDNAGPLDDSVKSALAALYPERG